MTEENDRTNPRLHKRSNHTYPNALKPILHPRNKIAEYGIICFKFFISLSFLKIQKQFSIMNIEQGLTERQWDDVSTMDIILTKE